MTGVIIPTRGLVFTETIKGILDGFEGREYKIYLSHNLPTPDSFNQLVNQALADGCELVFITNDDVVVSREIIDHLMEADKPIACCAVPLLPNFSGYYEKDGEITLCGTSCLLVKREVFEHLDTPYFRTDIRYVTYGGEEHEVVAQQDNNFGGEEVYFCRQAQKKGYKIHLVPGMCRHLRLRKLGEHHSNHGLHEIYDL